MLPPLVPLRWLLALHLVLPLGLSHAAPVRIAEHDAPLLPVVIAENATADTKLAAQQLATMLGRMTAGKTLAHFDVQTGDGTTGIAVGLTDDFPALESDVAGREEYVLHSHPHGLHVIGA